MRGNILFFYDYRLRMTKNLYKFALRMDEFILQYIWFNRLCFNIQTDTDGNRIEIIDVGVKNTNAGPDAFNSKIKINDTMWAGNVEFHNAASDWHLHGHDKDKAYNNVILHVVAKYDSVAVRENGSVIPTVLLDVPEHVKRIFDELSKNASEKFCKCSDKLYAIDNIYKSSWVEKCAVERMMLKADRIKSKLEINKNNWEEAFFYTLFRSFGFGVNSQAMEQLSETIPYKAVYLQRDNIVDLEALFLGQAGILDSINNNDADEYTQKLKSSYEHLKRKYTLNPMQNYSFKSMRMRPFSFPAIRLAELAALFHKEPNLLNKILNADSIDAVRDIFKVTPSQYWNTHFALSKLSSAKSKNLSVNSIDIIIINTVIPLYFAYGKSWGEEKFTEKAISFLESLPYEKNYIVRGFVSLGFRCESALDSQGLIHMYKEYCEKKDCLRCNMFRQIINDSI